ncbi:MAG: ABC transporter permease [Promethearchaeota archaeon]|jgi:peptide/nickel transport system permease protein
MSDRMNEIYPVESGQKNKILRYLKFYLVPGWRNPEFSMIEYEIGKVTSKRRAFRRILKPLTLLGFILLLFIAFCAIYAPWLSKFTVEVLTDKGVSGGEPFSIPSPEHPLGTTKYAYDILARMLWGCRTALSFGITTIMIAAAGGIVVGTISAYFGGWVDSFIMRIADLVMIFPALILLILFSQMIGEQLPILLALFGILSIPAFARLMRSSVFQVKQNLYIEAAETGGAKSFKIMFKHIIPNAISPIIINFFGGVGAAILGFTAIAFLGFGDQSLPDWGTDINFARTKFSQYYAAFWPGLFILIAVLGFMLIGDGLRDALDPRLRVITKRTV